VGDEATVTSGEASTVTSSTGGPAGDSPSPGCGTSDFPASGEYTIDVSGTEREYIILLPDGYDNTEPFRLVMTWHGLGGSAERTAEPGFEGSYYGLEPVANGQAIFLSGQGLAGGMGTGWPNTDGQDVNFVRTLWEYLRGTYCIDESRVFSAGKSYGGLFSNVLGCAMGDVFRAIAPQSGWWQSSGSCVGQVAYWGDHGTTDDVISIDRGRAARDIFLEANGCGSTTTPWNQPTTTCEEYEGCDNDKTVVWCEFDGGHSMPSWASEAVWDFFMRF
jgi:poly(3-hydroxybutyrate) depolymerase